MPHIPPVAMVIIATIVIVALLALFWWWFMERPDRLAERDYEPRHTGRLPAVSVAGALSAAAERRADLEYAEQLHRMNTEPAAAEPSAWEQNVDQWSAEQGEWLRSMAAGPQAVWAYLNAGSLRRAWWAGR